MMADDPYKLERFLTAQEQNYSDALRELRRGRKQSHWIWYVFPQVAGLGNSPTAQHYAIGSQEEAVAYLAHPVLGQRLRECCEALLPHRGSQITDIMGFPDDLKLRSSMTLFASVAEDPQIFQAVLDAFYGGRADQKTIDFLS